MTQSTALHCANSFSTLWQNKVHHKVLTDRSANLPDLTLSFFIPPRCLPFWLFLATNLTLTPEDAHTHTHKQQVSTHIQRLCCWAVLTKVTHPMQHQHFYIQRLHLSDRGSLCYHRDGCCDSGVNSLRLTLLSPSSEQSKPPPLKLAHSQRHTCVLTDTVPLRQAVWPVVLDSTPFVDFVESHSWPGCPQGYISQTYTQQF